MNNTKYNALTREELLAIINEEYKLDAMIREYENDEQAQESDRQCDECEFRFNLNEQQERYFRAMLDIENEFYKTLSEEQRKDFRKLHRHPLISPNGYCGESTEKFSISGKGSDKNMDNTIYGLNIRVAPAEEQDNHCRFVVVENGTATNRPRENDYTEFYDVDAQLKSGKLQGLKCERFKYYRPFNDVPTEMEVFESLLKHGAPIRDANTIVFFMNSQGWLRRGGKYEKAV